MKKTLMKNKLHGAIVDLYFPEAHNGFVISDRTGGGTAISWNGHHYGVYFNGKIYCNIYPEGISADEWPDKFHAFSDNGKKVTYYPF